MHNKRRKNKKPVGDGGTTLESDAFRTEKIILEASQAGLTVADFEHMSIGMIFTCIIEYANALDEARKNSESGEVREATDEDYLAF